MVAILAIVAIQFATPAVLPEIISSSPSTVIAPMPEQTLQLTENLTVINPEVFVNADVTFPDYCSYTFARPIRSVTPRARTGT